MSRCMNCLEGEATERRGGYDLADLPAQLRGGA